MLSGIEIELLLPEGCDRLQLAEAIAHRLARPLELFLFPSKVPVPYRPLRRGEDTNTFVDALTSLMQDVATHHQARIQSVSPDGRFFYLVHRAARIRNPDGSLLLSVVHDNTLAGGERVAELVTGPLEHEPMTTLITTILEEASRMKAEIPPQAALHIHVEAIFLRTLPALQCLVRNHTNAEPLLRELLQTPPTFKNAAPLPDNFVTQLMQLSPETSFADLCAQLKSLIKGPLYGLNLFNILHNIPDKPTVELKLATSSLDPNWVLAVRQLFVSMVQLALRDHYLTEQELSSYQALLSALSLSEGQGELLIGAVSG